MLTKINLSYLNTAVALSGYMLFPGSSLLALKTAYFCLGTQFMAMASQTIGQILERDLDKSMIRTCLRPIPSQRISLAHAYTFAGCIYGASNLIFYYHFPIEALVLANTIFYGYIGVYIPAKKRTELNTLIGSIVGALPPLLGWAAAGGSLLALEPLSLL